MKKYFLIICTLTLLIPGIQTKASRFYNIDPISGIAKVLPDDATEIINDIIAVIGLKPNFEVRAADIPNAAAVAYNGKRYIMYNPQFIMKLNAAAANKWASVSVLAHEIGHHLNGHTLKYIGSQPDLELEADEFSGFILRKMGATLSQSQVAMKLATNYKPSLTHPGQPERLTAIATGWNKAAAPGKDMAKYSKPVPQIPTSADVNGRRSTVVAAVPKQQKVVVINKGSNHPPAAQGNGLLNSKYILGKIDFQSDRTGDYYVTIRYNLVKIRNGQLYVVGKMLPTNNSDYPFIMRSDGNHTLFVDKYGKIVTANKQLAGYLKVV